MAKREASCPLCGARLSAAQVLDACEEIADTGLGVLSCHCPYCQGHFDARPAEACVEIGYLQNGRFDTVLSLPAEGMAVLRDTSTGTLRVRMSGHDWKFDE